MTFDEWWDANSILNSVSLDKCIARLLWDARGQADVEAARRVVEEMGKRAEEADTKGGRLLLLVEHVGAGKLLAAIEANGTPATPRREEGELSPEGF